MALFQKSVLKKYLKKINEQKLEKAWNIFTKRFHNKTVQANIRKAKEEQYQGEFLIDLFVNVLGYVKNPAPNFNLTTELRNVKGQKKADGGILKNEKAIAVIELKGTDTINLSKVETQAFGYKNNQPDAHYVIISNFEKLRFYIDNAAAYEEFNLFELTREKFKILWLCLSKQNLFKDVPKQIKEDSLIHETKITNKLYKDYTAFRIELFEDIVRLNPQYDKLIVFKKTQKLLDRFLFLLFAEDRGLLSPNSTRQIIQDWKIRINSLSGYISLYDNFKRFFTYLNKGYKTEQYDIFAYNGGLFETDDILDNIKISDTTLYRHTLLLSGYDFDSEVSVNILGHIFEHSLNEIEKIAAELLGEKIQKQKTKRKKEGIFYTPNYITKYIIEQTIGELCEKKKAEFQIVELEYEQKNDENEVAKNLERLENYRNWLLQLTICDPACGSGAFLNQALEFLIAEHHYIDELQAKLLGKKVIMPNRNNAILENNIYGVDINEDAVHIAKLSLWLRTAKEGQKLTFLNNNIQAGNSLIDDETLVGRQAFSWEKAFPKVFAKGGFDVIMGNPPYVTNKLGKQTTSTAHAEMTFFKEKYGDILSYKGNLFTLFIGLSHKILKNNGIVSFIVPNVILFSYTFAKARDFISENFAIKKLLHLKYEPFEAASIGGCLIFNFEKTEHTKVDTLVAEIDGEKAMIKNEIVQESINYEKIKSVTKGRFLIDLNGIEIIKKCFLNAVPLGNLVSFYQGIITGNNKKFIANSKKTETHKPILRGANIKKYHYSFSNNYVFFDKKALWSNTNEVVFETKPKLINRQTGSSLVVALDENGYYCLDSTHCQTLITDNIDIKSLLCIENSKLINFIYNFLVNEGNRVFAQLKTVHLKKIPIVIPKNQEGFIEKANLMMKLKEEQAQKIRVFSDRITANFEIDKWTKKMSLFYQYDFKTFVDELKKKKIKLSLLQQDEWQEYFNLYKANIIKKQTDIHNIDNEINAMIYELYGLTNQEIEIVEQMT